MIEIRWEAEAIDELDADAAFYETRVVGLGDRFRDAIEITVNRIAMFPRIGRKVPRTNVRIVVVNGFPYKVVYCEHDGGLRIVAIAHSRRHPTYWRRRLKGLQ